jgi:hypothetical protein
LLGAAADGGGGCCRGWPSGGLREWNDPFERAGERSGPDTAIATTTTAPASSSTTITVPPSTTTVPATTTTTVVADATTADPELLARQLQTVLDRYESLVMRSRSNPELPFTDSELISELQTVATTDFVGLFWVPKWQQARDAGTAARPGARGSLRVLLTSLNVEDAADIAVKYCYYDDGVTFRFADGSILDGAPYVDRGVVTFVRPGSAWLINDFSSSSFDPSSANPCPQEAVAP